MAETLCFIREHARIDYGKLAFNVCIGILTKVNTSCEADKRTGKELFVCSKYGCTKIIVNNRANSQEVKTVTPIELSLFLMRSFISVNMLKQHLHASSVVTLVSLLAISGHLSVENLNNFASSSPVELSVESLL